MGEERKIVLNLLSEGKITVEEAEQLLAALEGEVESVDEADSVRVETISEGDLHGRLSKVFAEMVEAGQELPGRLSRAVESAFGGFGWSFRGVRGEKSFEEEICGQEINAIDFAANNGSIKLAVWEKPGFRVVVRATVVDADSRDEADRRLESVARLVVNDGKVSIDCEDKSILDSMSIEAYFPKDRKYDVFAHTRNGSITLDRLNGGHVEVCSSNGRIALDSIKVSTLAAETANGAVTASGHLGDGSIETSNGSVTAALAYESGGHLNVRTSNGSIRIKVLNSSDVSYEVNAETKNGATRVLDEGAAIRSERRSTGGQVKKITVSAGDSALDDSAKVTVDARAMNGSITVESCR
jgi:DUF4097 and DUF4098 domain-containing protein YvlB